jgi:polyphosphate kinase
LSGLNPNERAAVDAYFLENVFPVLTPLAFDPGRPFPHISNLSLNLAAVVRDEEGQEHFARIKVPDTLPQLVAVKGACGDRPSASSGLKEFKFIWLEQLIASNLGLLFPGLEIVESYPFRVTRAASWPRCGCRLRMIYRSRPWAS